MSVGLSLLFAVAALAGVWTIWRAIAANLSFITDLKRRAAMPNYGAEIYVTFRDHDFGPDEEALVRQRRARHGARPKPVTHRLHQFARRTAA